MMKNRGRTVWQRPSARALAAGIAVTLSVSTSPALALQTDDALSPYAALSEAALAELRGGMIVGAMHLDFVVTISSQAQRLDDAAMGGAAGGFGLSTVLHLDDLGRVASATNVVSGTPATSTLPQAGQIGDLEASVGDAQTQLIHQMGLHHLSMITRNTSDFTRIGQDTRIDLTARNLTALSQQVARNSLASRLGRTAGLAALRN